MFALHQISSSILGLALLSSLGIAQSSKPRSIKPQARESKSIEHGAISEQPVATARFPSAALFVIENCTDADGVARRRRLVRFPVHDGQLGERSVVLEAHQRVFGHFGRHRIVDNRYMVTPDRAVFDLESGRLASGRAADEAREAAPVVARGRANSPHGLGWAEVTFGGELLFHPRTGEARSLGNGFGYTLSPLSSGSVRGAPIAWIDAQRLVTQRANGELFLVDLEGNIEPFVSIEGVREPVSSPTLEWDPAGRLIYTCADSFVINVKARTATPSRWWDFGHGFTIEREPPKDRGRIVRYRGEEIGCFDCVPYRSKATIGRIAIACAPRGRLGYPDTVRVWDVERERWSGSELWINSIVGWVQTPKPAPTPTMSERGR